MKELLEFILESPLNYILTLILIVVSGDSLGKALSRFVPINIHKKENKDNID